MKTLWATPILFLILSLPACSLTGSNPVIMDSPQRLPVREPSTSAGYIPWAFVAMVIARDGSEWVISPNRTAAAKWGYHLNAVKLLEVSPGQNCINIGKIEMLATGDLAVDIAITHPYDNAAYT